MSGTFLVFEGIDGSGKQTLCHYARERLESRGVQVETYQYPDYESPWGRIIEDFLLRKEHLSPSVQFLTYAADIIKDQPHIREYLKKGEVILADRYITSTIAFQCAHGFDFDKAKTIVQLLDVAPPDVIFYMKVPPDIGRIRKKRQKGELDRHEIDTTFLEKVVHMYDRLYQESFLGKKWIEIDANRELPYVKAAIASEIKKIL
ncbi:MAG: dTMP kinase [Candidatus Methanofastidiosia archaeon]